MNTFVENFRGCYRTGVDGGRDMRSFSGLYFILRMVVCLIALFSFNVINNYVTDFNYCGVTFLIVALTIALVQPYRKAYANVLDTLLLTDLALILLCNYCNTGSSTTLSDRFNPSRVLSLAPMVMFILILVLRMIYKYFKSAISGFSHISVTNCSVD